MVASAIVILLVIFLLKNKSLFKNIASYTGLANDNSGLTYDNEAIGTLVNRDLDGDGVLDWEEALWGTDPTLKDSNSDGVMDNVEIEKLKQQSKLALSTEDGVSSTVPDDENLTETDKFSREFFATIATLSQNGDLDDATIEKLGTSLSEHIANSAPRKIFTQTDLKITKDGSITTFQTYNLALGAILKGYPVIDATDVLKRATTTDENIDSSVLYELNPLIEQLQKIIESTVKMQVPIAIGPLHLEALNAAERVMENLDDLQMVDSDVLVALTAINQYETNNEALQSASFNLQRAIWEKLKN